MAAGKYGSLSPGVASAASICGTSLPMTSTSTLTGTSVFSQANSSRAESLAIRLKPMVKFSSVRGSGKGLALTRATSFFSS